MLLKNDRVLFQGDSITNAFRMPQEVSTAYQLGAGWAMICAAAIQARRPLDGIEFVNRGVSGDCLEKLSQRWEEDCLKLGPTLLSILVGVNETLGNGQNPDTPDSLARYETQYTQLLQRTLQALPGVRLVLCEPFLLKTGAITQHQMEHQKPRRQVARRLAKTFDAIFVPVQEELEKAAAATGPEYWLFDGIHPNAAGQWLLARQWYRLVEGGEL